MLIKGYDLNNELIMELGKFAVFWNLFEKNHCKYKCSFKAIKKACSYITVSKDSQAAFAKALNNMRWWFDLVNSDFVSNVLYSTDRQPTGEESQYIKEFLDEGNDSPIGCLLCVYRVRNNMMHGIKSIEGLNDQFDIFKAANKVLEEL